MFGKKTKDKTIERNYLARMYNLVKEYELTKAGKHPRYRFASDFYKANNLTKQNFIKYYHRYKEVNNNTAFIPRKRGPKYTTRRPVNFIEKQKAVPVQETAFFIIHYTLYNIYQTASTYTSSQSSTTS